LEAHAILHHNATGRRHFRRLRLLTWLLALRAADALDRVSDVLLDGMQAIESNISPNLPRMLTEKFVVVLLALGGLPQ
jgi:hypothetical protein